MYSIHVLCVLCANLAISRCLKFVIVLMDDG